MPPSPEERERIKRREKALDAQVWFRAGIDRLRAARKARQANAAPKAPALHGSNGQPNRPT